MNRFFFFLTLFLFVAGCGTVPPAPVDRFYRLQPVRVSLPSRALVGAIAVSPFRADSVYAERPIIYADEARSRQLRQYHYHLWLYPPAQVVQEHFIASLGGTLDLTGGNDAPNRLEGRVVGFERVVSIASGKRSKAVVALELKLMAAGKPLLSKVYQAEYAAHDESLDAFAGATEQALGMLYTEFVADVERVPLR